MQRTARRLSTVRCALIAAAVQITWVLLPSALAAAATTEVPTVPAASPAAWQASQPSPTARSMPTPALAFSSGRRLYEAALALDGQPVAARHAGGGWRLPAAAAACANCHGLHADGGREGAIAPPSLHWVRDDPESRTALERALRVGRGRDGRVLDLAMPRFELAAADVDALQAYLVHLASPEAVVARTRPWIVTLLPMRTSMLPDERVLEEELETCFAARAQGPRPMLGWHIVRIDAPSQAADALRELLNDGQVALIVAPSLRGWEEVFARILAQVDAGSRRRWPPILFPLSANPLDVPQGAAVHWLFGGEAERNAAIASAREMANAEAASLTATADIAAEPDAWIAVPARIAPSVESRPRALGALWGTAACQTTLALLADAGDSAPKSARESWAAWARRRMARLPRLETGDGFTLEPSHRIAVTEWAVWRHDAQGKPKLVHPSIRVEPRR